MKRRKLTASAGSESRTHTGLPPRDFKGLTADNPSNDLTRVTSDAACTNVQSDASTCNAAVTTVVTSLASPPLSCMDPLCNCGGLGNGATELVARATTRPARPSDEVAGVVFGEANRNAAAEKAQALETPCGRGHGDPAAIIQRAREEVSRLCAGRGRKTHGGLAGRDWTMCVPVRPDDSDMVFADLIILATALLADASRGRTHAGGVPNADAAPSQEDISGDIARGKP